MREQENRLKQEESVKRDALNLQPPPTAPDLSQVPTLTPQEEIARRKEADRVCFSINELHDDKTAILGTPPT